ncbi:MAG: winged helix-turn-helix domain-containing protein [Thermoplasmata archaeon]|jgi:predicted transcriptional regulator|nr:winged helix-turn-helix domain-containing protein [Thermoplasmata archaeon]
MDPFDMFNLVLDKHTSRILDLTSDRPFNAGELSELVGIPLAACYRRIRVLKGAGLLKEDSKVQSEGGKSVSAYKSTMDSAEVVLEDGRLSIQMSVEGKNAQDEIDFSTEASMLWWQPSNKKTE